MKKIISSMICVVSLISAINMFAMQGGDANKVQALITSGKTTDAQLATFAKVTGKLQDKLGISDADYKAYLAQKGGAATGGGTTGGGAATTGGGTTGGAAVTTGGGAPLVGNEIQAMQAVEQAIQAVKGAAGNKRATVVSRIVAAAQAP